MRTEANHRSIWLTWIVLWAVLAVVVTAVSTGTDNLGRFILFAGVFWVVFAAAMISPTTLLRRRRG
jgi:hypothetical protein